MQGKIEDTLKAEVARIALRSKLVDDLNEVMEVAISICRARGTQTAPEFGAWANEFRIELKEIKTKLQDIEKVAFTKYDLEVLKLAIEFYKKATNIN